MEQLQSMNLTIQVDLIKYYALYKHQALCSFSKLKYRFKCSEWKEEDETVQDGTQFYLFTGASSVQICFNIEVPI